MRNSQFVISSVSAYDTVMQREAERLTAMSIEAARRVSKNTLEMNANLKVIIEAMHAQGYRKNAYLDFAIAAVKRYVKTGLAKDHCVALEWIKDAADISHWKI
jgi:hypothetical protein